MNEGLMLQIDGVTLACIAVTALINVQRAHDSLRAPTRWLLYGVSVISFWTAMHNLSIHEWSQVKHFPWERMVFDLLVLGFSIDRAAHIVPAANHTHTRVDGRWPFLHLGR